MAISFPTDSNFLEPGIHPASVDEVEAALVVEFNASTTRRQIFDEWIELRACICEIVVLGRQWVNGSFVSRKRDPTDIDVATFLDADEVEELDAAHQDTLNSLMGSRSTAGFPRCDSFAIVEYPEGHPIYEASVQTKQVFETTFYGFDRDTCVAKGFIEVAAA